MSFKSYYKKRPANNPGQEERRQTILQEQKNQRSELQDANRGFDINQSTETQRQRPRSIQSIFGKDLQLQLSEWLREKPNDFSKWLLIPCPKGQRCWVVAYRQKTTMYNRKGRYCFQFQSNLPGNIGNPKHPTILDCIYDCNDNKFYVLDILSCGKQSFRFCEAQFRFFWLRSRFAEENYDEISTQNEKSFHLLKNYEMYDNEAISQIFQEYPMWPDNKPTLDGYLFYHKEAHYTYGTTPLVGWLFAFMVPDILGMQICDDYQKPDDYTNPYEFMYNFEMKAAFKKQSKKFPIKNVSNIMDYIQNDNTDNPHSLQSNIHQQTKAIIHKDPTMLVD